MTIISNGTAQRAIKVTLGMGLNVQFRLLPAFICIGMDHNGWPFAKYFRSVSDKPRMIYLQGSGPHHSYW